MSDCFRGGVMRYVFLIWSAAPPRHTKETLLVEAQHQHEEINSISGLRFDRLFIYLFRLKIFNELTMLARRPKLQQLWVVFMHEEVKNKLIIPSED